MKQSPFGLLFIVTVDDQNTFPANDTTNSIASIDASTLQSKGLVKGSVTSSQVTVAANNMNALATASGTLLRQAQCLPRNGERQSWQRNH